MSGVNMNKIKSQNCLRTRLFYLGAFNKIPLKLNSQEQLDLFISVSPDDHFKEVFEVDTGKDFRFEYMKKPINYYFC